MSSDDRQEFIDNLTHGEIVTAAAAAAAAVVVVVVTQCSRA